MNEREKLEEKIQLLLEERQLLDRHLESQAAKQRELDDLHVENERQAEMVRSTMGNLQVMELVAVMVLNPEI